MRKREKKNEIFVIQTVVENGKFYYHFYFTNISDVIQSIVYIIYLVIRAHVWVLDQLFNAIYGLPAANDTFYQGINHNQF